MRVLQPTRFSYPYSIPRNKKCYTGFDWLRAGRSGNRNPVKARFSAPVQTGTGAHPASCTMGTVSFPGVKRPGRGVNHPPTSSAEVKERIELYLYSPLWVFMACSRVATLYLYIFYTGFGIDWLL